MPSPTGTAGPVADMLAGLLIEEGFEVERVAGGHPAAPAVVARFDSERPGRILQFDGHLDTVHLPFVPPSVADGRLWGSGAADMKAGIAAAVEALRALRDARGLVGGGVLFTAHDLHESPWGDGSQIDALMDAGYVGDGVLIPEYFNAALPVAGRGGFSFSAEVHRPGPAVHEVLRPDEPAVLTAAARLVTRLDLLNQRLSRRAHPFAGTESVFVGRVQGGTIYNEFPHVCNVEGTRRWLPGSNPAEIEREFRAVCAEVARDTRTTISLAIRPMRDAFELNEADPLVASFQSVHEALQGARLPAGGKPFIDDGNSFWSRARVAAITHGPNAGGAHTVTEWVCLADLARVARLYALTAVDYCPFR